MPPDFDEKIGRYRAFDWKSLLRNDLGQHSLEEVKQNIEGIKEIFDSVVESEEFENLPTQFKQQLDGQLNNLFNFANEVTNQFQNVSDRQNWITRIRNFEFDSWNGLKSILEFIDFKSKETSEKINFAEYKSRFESALAVADELTQSGPKYEKAKSIAENWIKTEGAALSVSLDEKAEIFNQKAQEHKKIGVWWWFGGGILFGLLAIGLIVFFIVESGLDITVGSALIRISVLVIASYFSYFCLQQFLNHRRFYESYRFKAMALRTMEELYKAYTDPKEKELILGKALGIIFKEPVIKEGKQLQQKVIDDLFELLKSKV